jgi:flagellar export protein FliJ
MMARFHFRLATLLRLRETARDQRRLQLAEAERADAVLRTQLAELGARQRQLQDECRAAAAAGEVDLPRLVEAHRYAAALREQAAELEQERRTLAAEIDRRRQTLVEADRDVRTLEKLRESQRQAHRREEERQEARQIDEAARGTAAAGRHG